MSVSSGVSTSIKKVIQATLSRPVAFHPILARICGSVNAGLMLSQAIYWSERGNDADGWFYKSQCEWQEEICLTRAEQEGARKKLQEVGFWEEKRIGSPARLWYRIDSEKIAAAIAERSDQIAENQQSRLRKTSNPDCGKPAIQIAENQQSIDCGKVAIKSAGNQQSIKEAETTTETTRDYLQARGRAQRVDLEGVALFEGLIEYLKAWVKPHSFETWIKPLRFLFRDAATLHLEAPLPEFELVAQRFAAEIRNWREKQSQPWTLRLHCFDKAGKR